MRIVIEATAALSGGKVYLTNLLPQFAALAFQHEFIIFHNDDLNVQNLKISGPNVSFRSVNLPASNERNWLWVSVLKVFWRLFVFPWHLWRLRPAMVFSNTGFGPAWRPRGVKLALALHNSAPFHSELQKEEGSLVRRLRLAGLHWLLNATLRTGDCAIVFSQDLKQLAAARSPKLANAAVIYHGIDWGERERNAPPEVSVLGHYGVRQPYLLYVSQFHRYKNVHRLLDAFARMRDSAELSLVLVGKPADENYEQEIAKTIVRLGLETRVKMIPGVKREQLKPLYRSAHGFVYPSLVENCPFAVLEALAYGLPIATSRQSALPEMAGEAAIYFDPYSVEDMARAMERLVWDEALRGELREKAIAQAAGFTWEKTARQTLQVFEAIGRRSG